MAYKELTPAQSLKKVKSLVKGQVKVTKKDWIPGNIIFTVYNAKYINKVFDRTPLVLILRRNSTHTLGLNFHWLPFNMRVGLVKHILKLNKKNIAKGKPLDFSYQQLKPMLKNYGYAPVIRLYINKNFQTKGTVIPPDRLAEVAALRTETFFVVGKKFTAEQLYSMAQKAGKRRNKKRKKINM